METRSRFSEGREDQRHQEASFPFSTPSLMHRQLCRDDHDFLTTAQTDGSFQSEKAVERAAPHRPVVPMTAVNADTKQRRMNSASDRGL
jgi:hypothetical protein